MDAADGRTLGLFSSRRAAETAAEAARERLPHLTILAQGEAQLPELARLFTEDPHACLFGTLSLWQGLDVPGDLSVIGFDDSALMICTDPPLTTVRQPIEAMGQAAVAQLLSQVGGTQVSSEELLFEPELVVRASTGPAVRAALPSVAQ